MRPFEYIRAASVAETIALLDGGGEAARPLAGGTDLLTLMKADLAAPEQLVDIKRLGDLAAGVSEAQGGLTLGALTTLAEIETSPLVRRYFPLLAEAASLAATPQLRNMATIGGNLLQRPRCWYFRNPRIVCWLKGGDECQARDGENQLHALLGDSPCVAVHPSDLAPALLALDARLRVRGAQGERELALAEFFALPEPGRRSEHTLAGDELIVSIHVPALPDGARSTYLKAMDRKVWAFALVGVAAVVRLGGPSGRRVEEARVVLSGVAPIPWRAQAAEQALVGAEAGEELFARAAEQTLVGAQPLAENGYKIPLLKSLVRRALETLAA